MSYDQTNVWVDMWVAPKMTYRFVIDICCRTSCSPWISIVLAYEVGCDIHT